MNKWISVKDELPPEERRLFSMYIVTIYSHYTKKYIVSVAYHIEGKWEDVCDDEPLGPEYEVTHWMALPSAPESPK